MANYLSLFPSNRQLKNFGIMSNRNSIFAYKDYFRIIGKRGKQCCLLDGIPCIKNGVVIFKSLILRRFAGKFLLLNFRYVHYATANGNSKNMADSLRNRSNNDNNIFLYFFVLLLLWICRTIHFRTYEKMFRYMSRMLFLPRSSFNFSQFWINTIKVIKYLQR